MGGGGALEMDDMMKKMMDGMKMGGGGGGEMMSMGGGDMSSMMSGSKLSSSSMVRPIANLSDRKIVLDPSKLFCSFWTIIWTGFGTIEGQGRNHLIFQPEIFSRIEIQAGKTDDFD